MSDLMTVPYDFDLAPCFSKTVHIGFQPVVRKLDLRKKICFGLVTVVVFAVPFLFGLASGTHQAAEARTADAANETFGFEVAAIKPDKSGSTIWGVRPTPDGLSARATLQRLIRIVYRIEPNQISGAPGWVSSERYDIEAKIDQADRKSTRLNSSHEIPSRMPSSA